MINQTFIPASTGGCQCNPDERRLLSLPISHVGLNIINSVISASGEYDASEMISEALKNMIVQKNESFSKSQLQSIQTNVREQKQQETQSAAQEIRSPPKQRMMDLLSEKGSSKWLLVLPIRDQDFNLNKGEFRDAIYDMDGR